MAMKREKSLEREVLTVTQQARAAGRALAQVGSDRKDAVLEAIAQRLLDQAAEIQRVNDRDVTGARKAGLSSAMCDRLTLTDARIAQMAQGLRDVAALRDPIGETVGAWKRPNGLHIAKVRVPIGVVGFIYESRPNVTADAAGLCIKSGNAVILRGGSEAFHSNRAIVAIVQDCLREGGLPVDAVQYFSTTDRKAVDLLLQQDELVDVIVPRGGKDLIRKVVETSRIPVVRHLDGICHTYVDQAADVQMAVDVAFNAKVQRPSVCNAMETLLVHEKIAKRFLPRMAKRYEAAGVELRGCAATRKILPGIKRATKEDWATEYLDMILSIKVVKSFEEAVAHITQYGSAHSDAIITEDYSAAERFLNEVDAAAVFVNTSTYFHDGFQFGLGAEMGISTNRLHCRGPMGLEELTTVKWQVRGTGQIRT